MNENIDVIKKSLLLSDQEWNDLSEKVRNSILQLMDPKAQMNLGDPKEGRAAAAEGIKRVLALDNREYALLPDFAREKLLKKLDEL